MFGLLPERNARAVVPTRPPSGLLLGLAVISTGLFALLSGQVPQLYRMGYVDATGEGASSSAVALLAVLVVAGVICAFRTAVSFALGMMLGGAYAYLGVAILALPHTNGAWEALAGIVVILLGLCYLCLNIFEHRFDAAFASNRALLTREARERAGDPNWGETPARRVAAAVAASGTGGMAPVLVLPRRSGRPAALQPAGRVG